MENCVLTAFEKRRSVYGLGKDVTVQKSDLTTLFERLVKTAPSAFNSQSARVVALYETAHQKLWQIVLDSLQKIVPAEKFEPTSKKIESFAKAYGTVLFFEDMNTVQKMQKDFPAYAQNFESWSLESNGMLQMMFWSALAAQNIGASLQHYNPIIDQEVSKTWNLPAEWKLLAQMPFGSISQEPSDKTFLPIEDRFKVFP